MSLVAKHELKSKDLELPLSRVIAKLDTIGSALAYEWGDFSSENCGAFGDMINEAVWDLRKIQGALFSKTE